MPDIAIFNTKYFTLSKVYTDEGAGFEINSSK